MMDNLFTNKPRFKGMATLRKSSKKISHPPRSEKDNWCFVAKMKLHNLEAFVLPNPGCMSDSVSPEFATSANLKAHELEEPMPLQLGTVGSCSKINFGLFTNFEIGKMKDNHYFNVININRYNVILGTMFMRKHSITLDFKCNEVWVKGMILDMTKRLQAGEDACHATSSSKGWVTPESPAACKKKDLDKDGPSSTQVQPPSVSQWTVEVQEVDDIDKPHPSGLRLSDPILLGPEDDLENSDDLEEIIHEFTQDQFPDGPNFEKEEFEASVPMMLPPKQVDDLNDVDSAQSGNLNKTPQLW
jgi:hypothetical protein